MYAFAEAEVSAKWYLSGAGAAKDCSVKDDIVLDFDLYLDKFDFLMYDNHITHSEIKKESNYAHHYHQS